MAADPKFFKGDGNYWTVLLKFGEGSMAASAKNRKAAAKQLAELLKEFAQDALQKPPPAVA
jgi:hypothetical protein